MTHPIPDAALDDRLGIVGTAGSGKTYAAGTAAERILARKGRVIIPDPLGVWYGLRLMADGRAASPYNVVIFGGRHGDLPITENSGALIGETVARMAESAIIDLSDFGTKAAERRFMLAFLTALYRHANEAPVHLIFDEADMWAPERLLDKEGDAAKLLGMMETVVRRGRIKGFIPWLITQRPAVLSKNVLSQVDGLIAMKLTSSQDRDALGAWVEGQADREQWKEIRASLAALERGQGIIWLPARGILKTAAFPAKRTFDSSRTPKRGEHAHQAKLTPLDLPKLKERMAAVEAETKANDPKLLKAEIARLKAELAKAGKTAAPDTKAIDHADARGYQRGKIEGYGDAIRQIGSLAGNARQILANAQSLSRELDKAEKWKAPKAILAPVAQRTEHRPSKSVVVGSSPAGRANGALPKGEAAILTALIQHQASGGCRRDQLTVLTGYKRSSRDAYIQRLRERGLAEARGEMVMATDAGVGALPEITPLPTGQDLRRFWIERLPDGERRVLEILIEAYPDPVERDKIDERTGYRRSSRDAYIQRLRARQLVVGDRGEIRASDDLFEG